VSYNIQFEQYKNHYAYGEDGKTINTIKKCFFRVVFRGRES